MGLTIMEAVKLSEYKKSNKNYWNRPKFYKQVINKTLLIAEAFYLDYSLFFF